MIHIEIEPSLHELPEVDAVASIRIEEGPELCDLAFDRLLRESVTVPQTHQLLEVGERYQLFGPAGDLVEGLSPLDEFVVGIPRLREAVLLQWEPEGRPPPRDIFFGVSSHGVGQPTPGLRHRRRSRGPCGTSA